MSTNTPTPTATRTPTNTPITTPTNTPTPSQSICRTAGFWGTHSGGNSQAACSQDITLQALDLSPTDSISVCGEVIDDTNAKSASSALEALCVSPQGDPRLQLARQLMAMALNCLISGWGPACQGAPADIEDIWNDCNPACTNTTALVGECIARVDCFNKGGALGGGACITGMCSIGGAACGPEAPCAQGAGECQEAESCHTRSAAERSEWQRR